MAEMSSDNKFNVAPDGPLGKEKKGALSVLGDPLGQVLDKGLRLVGQLTGQVGKPAGEAMLKFEDQVKDEGGYQDNRRPGGDRIGGNEQTGQNPLGL